MGQPHSYQARRIRVPRAARRKSSCDRLKNRVHILLLEFRRELIPFESSNIGVNRINLTVSVIEVVSVEVFADFLHLERERLAIRVGDCATHQIHFFIKLTNDSRTDLAGLIHDTLEFGEI
ncbi:hypothetical protein ACHAW5_002172 [Stephanodiscus triporus]|uniref:Uncharacterized protein n=1 Tax=Stephanodiscus triporus TaxID=2934178 RepID=A0ABD3Q450_9STRA